jgi:hypothetical protein
VMVKSVLNGEMREGGLTKGVCGIGKVDADGNLMCQNCS